MIKCLVLSCTFFKSGANDSNCTVTNDVTKCKHSVTEKTMSQPVPEGVNRSPVLGYMLYVESLADAVINLAKMKAYNETDLTLVGNKLEGDYGTWDDWKKLLIDYGKEVIKHIINKECY